MDTLITSNNRIKKGIESIIPCESAIENAKNTWAPFEKKIAENGLFKSEILENILSIAKRFSDFESDRLKLFMDSIELELNYLTHRTTARFSEEECWFEFLEFYSTKRKRDKKLGRLRALEIWLKLIFRQTPYTIECNWGENYEGYNLQFSIFKADEKISGKEILEIYHKVKVILDCTHRFSNCPNELVDGFASFKKSSLLLDFFADLSTYCANIDYSDKTGKIDQNYASYILTFVTIKPDVFEQVLLRASKGYPKFITYCHKRIEYTKPFKQNYFRHWKTMNLEKVLLLILSVKFSKELHIDFCDDTSLVHSLFKRRDLNLFLLSRKDVNENNLPILAYKS